MEGSGRCMYLVAPLSMTHPIATVLVQSIGSGCHSFHQIIESSPQSVVVREIEQRVVRQARGRGNWQRDTDVVPIPGAFRADSRPQRLRVTAEGRIGPRERMTWWSVWDGKVANCFCS